MGSLNRPLARPLVANARHERACRRITENCVSSLVKIRPLNRSGPDLRVQTTLLKKRAEVVADKITHLMAGPQTRGKFPIGVGFVLDMNLMDMESFLAWASRNFAK